MVSRVAERVDGVLSIGVESLVAPRSPALRLAAPATLHAGNDGLAAFLYDQSASQAIALSRPAILGGFSGQLDLSDVHLRDLALRGALVAWELYDNSAIALDLCVGQPLAVRELGRGQWLPPQRAYLNAPSGVLRLDSLGSLPFGQDAPRFAGASAKVPPGRYVATLHRRDASAFRTSPGLWGRPPDLLTLTPVTELRLRRRPEALLLYPMPEAEQWEGRYQSGDTGFTGLIVGRPGAFNSIAINLDMAAADAMKLRPGAFVRVAAGLHRYSALYLGDIRIDEVLEKHGAYTLSELRAAAPFLAYMDHWVRERRRDPSTVLVLSGTACGSYDFTGLKPGAAVEVKLDDRAREPLRWVSLDDGE